MIEKYREYRPTRAQRDKLYSDGYGEIDYIEHTIDLETKETWQTTGTEDFTVGRWQRHGNVRRTAYKKTGKKDRGGHDRWEEVKTVYAGSVQDCGKILRLFYFPGEEISIRQY